MSVSRHQEENRTAMTGRDAWHRRVESDGERAFLKAGEQSWTFAEADREIRRLAAGLHREGVTKGTRVAVGMENSVPTLFAHFALRELGAVMVALTPGLGRAELVFQIEHSEATVLLADEAMVAILGPDLAALGALEQVFVDSADHGDFAAESVAGLFESEPIGREALPPVDDLDPSIILYTSGSTSKPKGVVVPAGSFASVGRGWAASFGVTRDDTFLLPFTLAHGVGALVIQGISVASGCAIALEPKFSPSVFWQRVEATGSTVTLLFPAQLQILLITADDAPAESGLRLVLSHVYDTTFRDRFDVDVATVWGSTEIGAHGAGGLRARDADLPEGYVGTPLGDEEIRIVVGGGRECDVGEVGEVLVRHRLSMIEYLNDPEATVATRDDDGWIHTGDRGLLDGDGALHYAGRIKNMIKRSGENIAPEELEVILTEHPLISEAVVFGVPDPIRTEEIGLVASSSIPPEDVRAFVQSRMAPWKAPRYVLLLPDHLPKLPSGKIDRQAVERSFSPEAAWDALDRAAAPTPIDT
jgi:acyl-CoA synthetase (AMP-forming)/AMP-acid ligase II